MDSVLTQLLSPDNAVRRLGEQQLESLRATSPHELVGFLLTVFRSTSPPELRQLSLVLLRRHLKKRLPCPEGVKEDVWGSTGAYLWSSLAPSVQDTLAATLLEGLLVETSLKVREAAADAVGQVCVYHLSDTYRPEGWPGLWPFLHQCVMSPQVPLQVTALTIFERLGSMIGEEERQQASFPAYRAVFLLRMGRESPMEVRVAAVKAAASLLMYVPSASLEVLSPTLEPMLQVLGDCVGALGSSSGGGGGGKGEFEEHAITVSGTLCEVVETKASKLFIALLPTLVPLLTQIAEQRTLPSTLRRSCVETLVLFSEAQGGAARKCKALHARLTPVLLSLMTQWGESVEGAWEAAWEQGCDEDEDEDAEGLEAKYGAEALGRFAEAIKGKKFLPALQPHLAPLLSSTSWEARAAGLTALECCAGVVEEDEEQLRSLGHQLAPFASDPHPRVRAALQDALGALCQEKSPTLQMFSSPHTLPAILTGVMDASRRVRYNALFALGVYVGGLEDPGDAEYVQPEVGRAVAALLANLQGSKDAMVLTMCIICISRLANCPAAPGVGKELFTSLGPSLAELMNASDEALIARLAPSSGPRGGDGKLLGLQGLTPETQIRTLKGRALECLTVLGRCAGREAFAGTASGILHSVVSLLITLQGARNGASAADDPIQSYCWDALERLTAVLGPFDFAPVLPQLFPAIFKAIESPHQEPYSPSKEGVKERKEGEGGAEDKEEGEGEGEEGEEEDEEGYFAVKTDALADKASAIIALRGLFETLGKRQSNDSQSGGSSSSSGGSSSAAEAEDEQRAAFLAPYAPRAMELLLATLDEAGVAGVFAELRSECAETIPEVLGAMARVVPYQTLPSAMDALAAAMRTAIAATSEPTGGGGGGSDSGEGPASHALRDLDLPPPSSPTELYLRLLGKGIEALTDEMLASRGVGDEEGDMDPGGAEMTLAFLHALKSTLLKCCSRDSYSGVPATPATSPLAPPQGGPSKVAATFFPVLTPQQLDTLGFSFMALLSTSNQRNCVRSASKRVDALELIARAYPTLPPEVAMEALERGGGEGVKAVELLAKGGKWGAPVPGVLESEVEGGRDVDGDEEMENAQDEDAMVSYQAVSALGTLFLVSGPAFLPAFNAHVAPELSRWCQPGAENFQLRLAFFLMCDLLDNAGDNCPLPSGVGAWTGEIMPRFIAATGSGDTGKDLLQAASYGLGLAAASLSPATFAPYFQGVSSALQSVLWREKDKPTTVKDNAATSLVKMVLWQVGGDNKGLACSMWGVILGALPLTEDPTEAAYMVRVLCDLVQARDEALLSDDIGKGLSPTRLVSVLKMLALGISKKSLSEADSFAEGVGGVTLKARVVQALTFLQANFPGALLGEVFTKLTQREQKTLSESASSASAS